MFLEYHSIDTPLQKHVRTYMQLSATCVLKFVAVGPSELQVNLT